MELNTIYNGDASEVLKAFENNSIDLVVTSPPYSDLRTYGGVNESWNDDKFRQIADELHRVLKDGGTIVWICNDKTENGSKTLTSFKQALYFKEELRLNLNNNIIWQKSNPMPQVKQPRYSNVYEYMFVFTKGKPKTFNPIQVPCKCANQLYDSTTKNIGGENGRTHKTFNINKTKDRGDVWNIAVAQNKTKHPAVFPIQLAIDHILSWSNEGDIVLDPFMGSGTTALAAIKLNRNYIGIELNKEYVNMANERIQEFTS